MMSILVNERLCRIMFETFGIVYAVLLNGTRLPFFTHTVHKHAKCLLP
jgi:hypothetical protein